VSYKKTLKIMISHSLTRYGEWFCSRGELWRLLTREARQATRRGERWRSCTGRMQVFFSKNPNFLNFNSQNDLQKC